MPIRVTLLLSSFLLSGCITYNSNVFVNEKYKNQGYASVVILPFIDHNEGEFRRYYPEAAQVAQDALENELLNLGYEILHKEGLPPINLATSEPLDFAEIGRKTGAKVLVIGRVTSYVQGFGTHPLTKKIEYVRFGFEARAVHSETGVVIWKISAFRKNNGIFAYTDPVQNLVREVMQSLRSEMEWKGLVFVQGRR